MKTRILERVQTVNSSVDTHRTPEGKLSYRPRLEHLFETSKETILELKDAIPDVERIDLGDDEGPYGIISVSYNVKLKCVDIFIGKERVVEIGKEEAEEELKPLIREWNKQEIENDPELKLWCEVNDKNPEDVEVEKLQELLHHQTPLYQPSYIGVDYTRSTNTHKHTGFKHTHLFHPSRYTSYLADTLTTTACSSILIGSGDTNAKGVTMR